MYESAEIDGANRWQRMFHITLPAISFIIVMMFILNIGNIISVDFSTVLMMYNPGIYDTADVLPTYVYRMAFASTGLPQYSLSTAVGLFQSAIGMILILIANQITKKVSDYAIF
jgi:putative aldouronate transport system permease protein